MTSDVTHHLKIISLSTCHSERSEESQMKTLGTHNYFVYITTNKIKTVLYTGVTNDLSRRIYEHEQSSIKDSKSFVGKYKAHHLIYWERHQNIEDAIAREKEIKGWKRERKIKLIDEFNPGWSFLNGDLE